MQRKVLNWSLWEIRCDVLAPTCSNKPTSHLPRDYVFWFALVLVCIFTRHCVASQGKAIVCDLYATTFKIVCHQIQNIFRHWESSTAGQYILHDFMLYVAAIGFASYCRKILKFFTNLCMKAHRVNEYNRMLFSVSRPSFVSVLSRSWCLHMYIYFTDNFGWKLLINPPRRTTIELHSSQKSK